MPSLDKLKTKKASGGKVDRMTGKSGKSKDISAGTSEAPFFLQRIAQTYGCTDLEFKKAFAETIDSTLKKLDLLIEEQIRTAKGFLNEWGALFILYDKLNVKEAKLRKACEKYLSVANKIDPKDDDRQEKQKFMTAAHDIQAKLKARNKPKSKPKLSEKIIEKAEALDNLEVEVEEMMKAEKDLKPELDEMKGAEKKPKKKPLKVKPIAEPKPSKTKGHKRSFIVILNGGEGSGKSRMAQTFPTPFTIDLEDKLFDLIDYDLTLNLKEGEIDNLQPDDDYVVAIVFDSEGNIDYIQTEDNIDLAVQWYRDIGYEYHETLVIDVGKAVREASIRAEEFKKGRTLGQYEYIPITKSNKALLIPLIHFCRQNGRNLIIITHWEGKYETRKNAQGYDESVRIGQYPDVKEWLRDLVTWRIDFLKPDESGFDGKFIVDFQKAPGEQYFKLDITDKNLYEIISSPETLNEEKEVFRKIKRKQLLAEKEDKK